MNEWTVWRNPNFHFLSDQFFSLGIFHCSAMELFMIYFWWVYDPPTPHTHTRTLEYWVVSIYLFWMKCLHFYLMVRLRVNTPSCIYTWAGPPRSHRASPPPTMLSRDLQKLINGLSWIVSLTSLTLCPDLKSMFKSKTMKSRDVTARCYFHLAHAESTGTWRDKSCSFAHSV